jgi:hypothetical protein
MNFICFSSQYDVSRINHRFDTKKLVTINKLTLVDRLYADLTKLESKLMKNNFFNEKDLANLYRLVKLVKGLRKNVYTPPSINWYMRQG